MDSPDMDGTTADERDPEERRPDAAPAVADEDRTVDEAGLPVDEDDDVPVPLDADIEVPTADAVDQHRTVRLDDDHDQP